ncbi:hypothetical protein E2C01_012610 [Portunus trituberculatus]|uniref:Uncharacterized protein n=1 Tax=Portunus trituberculatus TaxID=210409 RepID=A0A5B7DEK7_PORTR|nr:hypothetical protein [Portunus trituberculatus]
MVVCTAMASAVRMQANIFACTAQALSSRVVCAAGLLVVVGEGVCQFSPRVEFHVRSHPVR